MSEERRCGTCRHWDERRFAFKDTGYCEAPIPDAARKVRTMHENGGDTCPTWEKKQ